MADLPVPTNVRRGRTYRFPFDRLGVGQCFIVLGMGRNTLGSYKAYAEAHMTRKFITRRQKNGVAVWRVA